MKITLALATALLSVVATWAVLSSSPRHSQDIPKSASTLRPIAEFERTFGVALSEQVLFKKSGLDLIRKILGTEAKVYLFVSRDRKKEVDARLHAGHELSSQELESVVKIQLEHEALWLRDFLPIPILRLYSHLTPTPSFVDFVYRDGNSFDDAAIHQFALAINSSVEHLPIVLDGGNFMSNGEICIISSEVSDDPEILPAPEQEPPLAANIEGIFRQALGCRETLIVSQIPHPHVDMWMKFVDPKTVLVNSIDPRAKDLAANLDTYDREKIAKVSRELDRTASLLEKKFRVVRIPMPLPINEAFLTYANAVLVNGKAIIPRYGPRKGSQKYVDETLFPAYENEVAAALQKYGFQTSFVEADDLIVDGGAFHCVTFHLPDLDAILKERNHLALRSKG